MCKKDNDLRRRVLNSSSFAIKARSPSLGGRVHSLGIPTPASIHPLESGAFNSLGVVGPARPRKGPCWFSSPACREASARNTPSRRNRRGDGKFFGNRKEEITSRSKKNSDEMRFSSMCLRLALESWGFEEICRERSIAHARVLWRFGCRPTNRGRECVLQPRTRKQNVYIHSLYVSLDEPNNNNHSPTNCSLL